MLNKKAIAALAAGATLVSGLAFAAPAMAVEVKDCPVNKEEWNLKSKNQAIADEAKTAWETATAAVPNKPIAPAVPEKAEVKALYVADGKVKMKDETIPQGTNRADYEAAQTYVRQQNAYVSEKANYDTKSAAATEAYNLYVKALFNVNSCSNPDSTQDQKNQEMIDKVYASKHNLDNKEAILNKKQKAFDDALKSLKSTTAKVEALTAVRDAAKAALDKFDASGVKDSATRTRLQDALDRAQAHLDRVAGALIDAKKAYDDALEAAKKAVVAYNEALQAYKDVYNEAIKMGIDPSALPAIVTSDPLDPSFPTVPGARDLYAKALKGEFGKAVQAAAKKGQKEAKKGEAKKDAGKKGAAAPAGAKLDTKAAAAASAAPLSKTGVTVMFTALAASMLAGIGAAVRKFRH